MEVSPGFVKVGPQGLEKPISAECDLSLSKKGGEDFGVFFWFFGGVESAFGL